MATARYRVIPYQGHWGVEHDGDVAGPYLTREAAFEAAVAPASLAIKQGYAVEVAVAAPAPDRPAN